MVAERSVVEESHCFFNSVLEMLPGVSMTNPGSGYNCHPELVKDFYHGNCEKME